MQAVQLQHQIQNRSPIHILILVQDQVIHHVQDLVIPDHDHIIQVILDQDHDHDHIIQDIHHTSAFSGVDGGNGEWGDGTHMVIIQDDLDMVVICQQDHIIQRGVVVHE